MTPFKIGLIATCLGIAIVAMLVFSGVLPGFKQKSVGQAGNIVLWSTLPYQTVINEITLLNIANKNSFQITYVQKDPITLEADFVDALAQGKGPDLVVLPHDLLRRQEDKLALISYQTYPEKTFNDTFIREGELLKRDEGVLGLPWYVDPMVLYYNDDLFTNAGVALPPSYWTEVANGQQSGFLKRLTVVDSRNTISQSAIALGQFNNIDHAKDIMAMLAMQAGDQVTTLDEAGKVRPALGDGAKAALNFLLQFTDPAKEQYTWNSALPRSRDLFTLGRLAMYLGSASDLALFRVTNPHLNIKATVMPQGSKQNKVTYGRLYSLSITKTSQRPGAALAALLALTSYDFSKKISAVAALPPARLDLIGAGSLDPFQSLFLESALISRAWLDPNPRETDLIFKTMLENVLVGRMLVSDAVNRANGEINAINK